MSLSTEFNQRRLKVALQDTEVINGKMSIGHTIRFLSCIPLHIFIEIYSDPHLEGENLKKAMEMFDCEASTTLAEIHERLVAAAATVLATRSTELWRQVADCEMYRSAFDICYVNATLNIDTSQLSFKVPDRGGDGEVLHSKTRRHTRPKLKCNGMYNAIRKGESVEKIREFKDAVTGDWKGTPLSAAIERGSLEILKVVVESGCGDLDARIDFELFNWYRNPEKYIVSVVTRSNFECARYLLGLGVKSYCKPLQQRNAQMRDDVDDLELYMSCFALQHTLPQFCVAKQHTLCVALRAASPT